MAKSNGLKAQVKMLKERLSRLNEACLRISQSLDVDTVLRETVSSARALAGAGYGGFITWDSSGQSRNFVSDGLSESEREQLRDLPSASELWENLRAETQPLRLEDFSAHVVSLGLPGNAAMERSFIGMPIRHPGAPDGYFFLLDKEAGREFTDEDEETMALFAFQAGAAIANARKYQDGMQAKADLEALVDTSPVGVVVFDARSGRVESFNQEIRRIVDDLDIRDRTIMEILEVATVKRADGRRIEPHEYRTLVDILREARTVRAEEIILEFPDGSKITTLINVTPIVSEQDEVLSVVVTVQDMTPIEEQERQRAEFLSMVNHEMRAPLATIKGCATTALGSSSILHPAESQQFFRIIDAQADHMSALINDLMDAAHIETGSLSVSPEPVELAVILDQARNMFTGVGHRNTVHIDLPADLPRVRAD